ncbi:hypothetical protein AAC387_Pa12g0565 [Persea americana]
MQFCPATTCTILPRHSLLLLLPGQQPLPHFPTATAAPLSGHSCTSPRPLHSLPRQASLQSLRSGQVLPSPSGYLPHHCSGHLPSSLCPAGLHAASGQIPALPAAATPPSPEPAVTSSLLAAAAISSLPCTQPSQTSPCTSLHPKLAGLVLPCLSPPAPLPVATHLHSASRHPPALSQRPPLLLPLSLVSVC